MRRLVVVLAAAAAGLAAAPAAQAARECDGLMVCVPVAGPWVLVPTGGETPRRVARWQVTCPRGYIVGGVDAELSVRAIDVTFSARLGSPVNPGISTERSALFTAVFTGTRASVASFRPLVGCIPTAGGGGRIPTSVGPNAAPVAVAPGVPTVRRVRTVRVRPAARASVAVSCGRGERLVDAWHGIGFLGQRPPSARAASSVRATRTVRGARVSAAARATAALGARRASVQVGAVCGGAP